MKNKKQPISAKAWRQQHEFFGTSYAYNLGALGGLREVGVLKNASGQWFVGFHGHKPGVLVRLAVAQLPCSTQPEELQAQFDDWANHVGLDPVARIAGGAE